MTLTQRFKRHPAATFAILSLCWVLLLYWRAFRSPFLYDDLSIIQKNTTIASLHSALSYFRTAVPFSTDFLGPGGSYYRPLTWMSFALDHLFWGLSAPGYHLTNILLHWLNGILGFLLLLRLGVPLLLSSATSLIWLALPVNSEVVVWTSARSHCLVFFFLLLALHACCWYVKTGRAVALACYIGAGLCALLSHELGVLLLPFTVVVIFSLRCWTGRTAVALFLSAVAAFAIYEWMRHSAGGSSSASLRSLWPVGISYGKYLGWFLFPLGMSIERSTDTPPAHFSGGAAVALLSLAALIALAIVFRRKASDIAAGLAWATVALLPVSGLVFLYQGVAERYDYMASAGLVFASVSLYRHLRARALQRGLAALLMVWTLCSAGRLYARLGDWATDEKLFQSSLEATPQSWILLLNLGNAYLQRGDLPQAEQTYRRTLQANSKAVKAVVNLGAVLEMEGNLPAAEQQFSAALTLDPDRADTYSDLATVVYAEGRVHEAAELFRKAIQLNPRDATSYFNLGLLYAHSGLTEVAAQLYGQALEIDPDYPDAQRALASLRKK